MKTKFLWLLPVLALTACDKPTSDADLTCMVDKYWQRSNALYLNNNYYEYNKDGGDTEIGVRVVTYDNYAIVTVDGITTKFEKVVENKESDEFGQVRLTYKGNFPGSERTALLDVHGDITNRQILQYSLSFVGQKTKNEAGREFSVSHSCNPVKEEYRGKIWSSAVPFNHHYKMPNKIERCITNICEKVYCGDENCTYLLVFNNKTGKQIPLSAQDAMSISNNWNYSDMKLYQNDGKLEEHEKDACGVLERLNKFIDDNDLFFDAGKEIQKARDNCGDECNNVIATGEMGDFLVSVPETEELRKIANSQKNAKFLSVFNPNSYAKQGYCLINIIPYSAMEKMGTPNSDCNYRIYCGVPEFMNYDEFYAVEVCH